MTGAAPVMIYLRPERTGPSPRLWFVLIVLVAVVVRLVGLGAVPPALFRDEAEKALTAWSLLRTGVDLDGNRWPIFVNAFGVTTSAIYQYATIPVLALLGPTDFSARLPAALTGILTVALMPWALRGTVRRPVALYCALALALSPWHIPFSRWAQQGIFVPLLLLVWWGGLESLRRGRVVGWLLGMGCAALAAYAYDPARLLVPLVLVAVLVMEWRMVVRRPFLVGLGVVVFGLVALPTLFLVLGQTEAAQARFRAISVFVLPLQEAVPLALKNYAAHFGPDFLMFRGDREVRHGAGGVLGWILAPGLWVGLLTSWWVRCRWRPRRLLVLLVLIGPMAAALTREGIPHALRTLGTAPFFCVLAVLGWRDLWRLATRKWPGLGVLRQKTLSLVVCGLLLLNSVPFGIRYFGSQPRDGAFSWQYGVRDGLETASPALQAGIPMVGCSVVGGRVLGAWYLLQLDQAVRKGPGIQYPLEEGPFGVSPAELDRTNGGLPRIYLAIPGLDPIPGGLRLPIWYRGYGSGDGKNPTLMELHINPAAVQLMRAGTVAVQP